MERISFRDIAIISEQGCGISTVVSNGNTIKELTFSNVTYNGTLIQDSAHWLVEGDDIDISYWSRMLESIFISESKIRIMPDTHAGAGCVIGTTMTIADKIIPNLVGVDIGCGMYVLKLEEKEISFEKLDKVIRENVPSGMNIREREH